MTGRGNVVLRPARSAAELETVRRLFLEYERDLGVSLCFQNFAAELADLGRFYGPPQGRLLLAHGPSGAAGAIGLRPLGEAVAEIKRLYVRPACRGTGLGRRLAVAILSIAERQGYRRVCLDTLPHLKVAAAMYTSLGFRPCAPYYDDPRPGILFFDREI